MARRALEVLHTQEHTELPPAIQLKGPPPQALSLVPKSQRPSALTLSLPGALLVKHIGIDSLDLPQPRSVFSCPRAERSGLTAALGTSFTSRLCFMWNFVCNYRTKVAEHSGRAGSR